MENIISTLTFSACILGNRKAFMELKKLVETEQLDWNQCHILHAYFAYGSVDEIKTMFGHCPSTDVHIDNDMPFKLAVMYNSLEVIQYLNTNYSPFNLFDSWPMKNNDFGHSLNVIVCALKNGNLDLIKYILTNFPILDKTEYVVEGMRFYFNNEPVKAFLMERFPDLPVIDWKSEDIEEVTNILGQIDTDTKKIMMKYSDCKL